MAAAQAACALRSAGGWRTTNCAEMRVSRMQEAKEGTGRKKGGKDSHGQRRRSQRALALALDPREL